MNKHPKDRSQRLQLKKQKINDFRQKEQQTAEGNSVRRLKREEYKAQETYDELRKYTQGQSAYL